MGYDFDRRKGAKWTRQSANQANQSPTGCEMLCSVPRGKSEVTAGGGREIARWRIDY